MSKNKNLIVNVSSKDVDNYLKFKESVENKDSKIKSRKKFNKKLERTYFKVYKDMLNLNISFNAVLIYSVIRNFIQIEYLYKNSFSNNGSLELDEDGNSNLIGMKKKLDYDTIREWTGISSANTIRNNLKELSDYGFISYKKIGGKINEFTLLRDMATYQPEEIEAIEKFMREKEEKENKNNEVELESEDDDFEW